MFRHLNPFTRLALREASYVKRGMPIAETLIDSATLG